MRKIVLDMQNALFSDAIANALQSDDFSFRVYQSPDPQETLPLCESAEADILMMEVTAYSPRTMEERMALRSKAKAGSQSLKIVLIVDENTQKALAGEVRQAKKDGLIDGFLYGSVSASYLSALMDTL